jgi:hypothetical protein
MDNSNESTRGTSAYIKKNNNRIEKEAGFLNDIDDCAQDMK